MPRKTIAARVLEKAMFMGRVRSPISVVIGSIALENPKQQHDQQRENDRDHKPRRLGQRRRVLGGEITAAVMASLGVFGDELAAVGADFEVGVVGGIHLRFVGTFGVVTGGVVVIDDVV